MALYSGDLAPLNQARVAQQGADRADMLANQQYLLGLVAERNRRSLGEGQIGAENTRTAMNRDVGMGQVGVGNRNVDARNAEIQNLLEIARMRDAMDSRRLNQQGGQFYDQLNANERNLKAQLDAYSAVNQGGGWNPEMYGDMPTSPAVYAAQMKANQEADAAKLYADQVASEINATRGELVNPGWLWDGKIDIDALNSGTLGPKGKEIALKQLMGILAQKAPNIEDRALIEFDPNTLMARPKQSAIPTVEMGSPPMDPAVSRLLSASRAAASRYPGARNFGLNPAAILARRRPTASAPAVPQAATAAEIRSSFAPGAAYLNTGGY
jgi:hypothetical protein